MTYFAYANQNLLFVCCLEQDANEFQLCTNFNEPKIVTIVTYNVPIAKFTQSNQYKTDVKYLCAEAREFKLRKWKSNKSYEKVKINEFN